MEVTLHLDTNAYAGFLRGRPDAVFILERAPSLAICPIVIGELKAGFALGSGGSQNLTQLAKFLESPRVSVPEMTDRVTDRYARVFKQLRLQGRPIPTNDPWIAAFAIGRDKALLTFDSHFDAIDGLKVIHSRSNFESLGRS